MADPQVTRLLHEPLFKGYVFAVYMCDNAEQHLPRSVTDIENRLIYMGYSRKDIHDAVLTVGKGKVT